MEALPIYRAEQGYKLTPGQLAAAVAEGGVGLIYLIDPLNPLGVGYSATRSPASPASRATPGPG